MPDKQRYVHEVEQQFGDWDRRINEVRHQVERKGIETPAIERLLALRQRAEQNFEILRTAGADEWEQYKADMAESTSELKSALERLEPSVHGKEAKGQATHQRPLRGRGRSSDTRTRRHMGRAP